MSLNARSREASLDRKNVQNSRKAACVCNAESVFKEVVMSRIITQRAIVSAFKEMLKDTPFNKITIGSLAEKTGINRQTFYYNFHDIYDLTLFMLEDELLPLIDGETDFSTCMLRIYDYFVSQRQMLLNIYRHIEIREINYRLEPVLKNVAETMVDAAITDFPLSAEDRQVALRFTALMISEFISRWIALGAPEQRDRFSRFADLLECNMKSTIRFLNGEE